MSGQEKLETMPFWHSCTGVVELAFWRHTYVYILEDNRTTGLLTQLFDVTPLCVENNTILTQMLNIKDPLCRKQYNIDTDT